MCNWVDEDYAKAVATYLGIGVSRLADFNSSLCTLNNVGGRGVAHTFTRQSLPMVWIMRNQHRLMKRGRIGGHVWRLHMEP